MSKKTPQPVVDEDLAQPAKGHVFMLAPDGATSCSFNGGSYDVDEEGFVEVPEDAVPDLMHHGFVLP